MFKLVVLAVCASLMVANVNAQLGGSSFFDMMLLSQLMSSNNNQNSASTTPPSTASTGTAALASGSSSATPSNPLASLFGGNGGNLVRSMMLFNGNTEMLMDMYGCGAAGLPAYFCMQRVMV